MKTSGKSQSPEPVPILTTLEVPPGLWQALRERSNRSPWHVNKKQEWCHYAHPQHGKCSFGRAHRIEYHYCGGQQIGFDGNPLSPEDWARITRNGTR